MKPAEALREAARSFNGAEFSKEELKAKYIELVDGAEEDNHFNGYFADFKRGTANRHFRILQTNVNLYIVDETGIEEPHVNTNAINNHNEALSSAEGAPIIKYNNSFDYSEELRRLKDEQGLEVNDNEGKPIVLLSEENSRIIEARIKAEYPARAKEKFNDNCNNGQFQWDNRDGIRKVVRQIATDNSTRSPNTVIDAITDYICDPIKKFKFKVKKGEVRLVDDILQHLADNNLRRDKSLASKVCKYLNLYLGKIDYYINDKFVRTLLPYYYEYYVKKSSIRDNELQKMATPDQRSHLKYEKLWNYLETIKKSSKTNLNRNQIDHIIWYCYKSFNSED